MLGEMLARWFASIPHCLPVYQPNKMPAKNYFARSSGLAGGTIMRALS